MDRRQPTYEDAFEQGELVARRPKPDWRCDTCSTLNDGVRGNCCYCGLPREDDDE